MQFHHAGIATDDAAGLADRYATLFARQVAPEERFNRK